MKIYRRILKIAGYGLGFVLLFLIIFAALTQTAYFKKGLRSIIIAEIEKELNGTVHIGKIDGNFLNRVSVESLAVFYGNTPLFSAGKIEVQYDPLSLFKKRVTIDSLLLESPIFNFVHLEDTSWNIGKLLKTKPDSPKGKFDWVIDVRTLLLTKGMVTIHDSLKIAEGDTNTYPFPKLDYHNFTAENIHVLLRATYKENDLDAHVISISFISKDPKFVLSNFRGNIRADRAGISAKEMSIQTRKSLINFDAMISGENIFDGVILGELKNDPTRLRFAGERIDFDELKFFLPAVGFLKGMASLDLDVDGYFDDLNVRRLNIDTYSTILKLAGKVRNLDYPDSLYLNVNIGDSKLDPADIHKLIPTVELPSFESVGSTSVYAQFIGNPLDFKPRLILKGSFGSVDIYGGVKFSAGLPSYSLDFSAKELNLEKLTNDQSLASSLTIDGDIKGEGTTLEDINSELHLSIDTANIQQFAVGNSSVIVKAYYNQIESQSTIKINNADATINADFDLNDLDNPGFKSLLTVSSFDVTKFFPDPLTVA